MGRSMRFHDLFIPYSILLAITLAITMAVRNTTLQERVADDGRWIEAESDVLRMDVAAQ